MNAKGKDESLSSWLCADWAQHGAPDIVVVGFQEMVDLNAVNVAVENKSQQRSQFWMDKIKATLNARENTMGDPMRSYTELSVCSLCVMLSPSHSCERQILLLAIFQQNHKRFNRPNIS